MAQITEEAAETICSWFPIMVVSYHHKSSFKVELFQLKIFFPSKKQAAA
jgi:hypothetical protein